MIERNITQHSKRFPAKLPYAYFIGLCLWIAFEGMLNGSMKSALVLMVCIPFLYQLKFESRALNIVLGMVLLIWSIWMTLAYIFDIAKITTIDNRSLFFILGGGVLVLLNFLASISILRKIKAGNTNSISIA